MHRIISLFMLLGLLGTSILSGGCTAYNVAVEERSVGDYANDEKITFIIEKDFLADDLVKYMDFDASSYEGLVYIVGEYESRAQVDRAVKIAKAVDGVRTVTTYMLPKRVNDSCGTTDNLDLYARLKSDLVADKNIWSTNIEIKTIQCNIVLLGVVGSTAEKERIIDYANKVPGARSVKSYLRVKR
ncbi:MULTISPECIES: BON domain-containing protein [unclassified Pseudodesulfovibrio]|uniref:BON domain-containing protein n=1 Tax=unclassified Pseudodesulfovibrio TaxID=2661612 RepID=UPI000FEC0F0B|nr:MULTISPECIES: BON domain-containing protein [unclassified Pseudodesulfovibrio]MCJ2164351.1 BON domain-containing protein [Pseudodesulfovibrio sp. S3-i]RWU04771.1 BON domain-containing protein [Pseudodesulfovibrio sp. S3]